MHITALFRDRETGAIQAATIWAHRITLPGIDLSLAIHPRYSLDLEGNVRWSCFGGYQLTEISSGYSVGYGETARFAIEVFMLRVKWHGVDGIKRSLKSR